MRGVGAFLLGLVALVPGAARGEDIPSDILAAGEKVNVDGLLDEWGGLPGVNLPIVNKASYKGKSDLSVLVQSLHDKDGLYFAITVQDETFIRTGAGTVGEDKILMWFGADAAGTKTPISLSFLPGDLSTIQQDLRFNGKKITRQSKREVVALESFAPKQGRWMAEIAIPWEKLPAELRGREDFPFCIAVLDGDDKSPPKTGATAASCELSPRGAPLALGRLVRSELATIFDGFLRDVKLSRADIVKEYYVDAGGDAEADRLAVVGPYVALLGTGLGENYYYYYRLGTRSPSDIKDIQLMDVDGDGKMNLVVRSLEYDTSMAYSQEIIRVFGFKDRLFAPIFGQEVSCSQKEGSIASKFEWKKKGKGFELTVWRAEARGLSEASYVDMDAKDDRDYQEILLPWGSDKKKTYRFASGRAEPVK